MFYSGPIVLSSSFFFFFSLLLRINKDLSQCNLHIITDIYKRQDRYLTVIYEEMNNLLSNAHYFVMSHASMMIIYKYLILMQIEGS